VVTKAWARKDPRTAPDIDQSRVQRVADAMYQFHMLTQPFQVSTMLG
jgi:hypothetical protein